MPATIKPVRNGYIDRLQQFDSCLDCYYKVKLSGYGSPFGN